MKQEIFSHQPSEGLEKEVIQALKGMNADVAKLERLRKDLKYLEAYQTLVDKKYGTKIKPAESAAQKSTYYERMSKLTSFNKSLSSYLSKLAKTYNIQALRHARKADPFTYIKDVNKISNEIKVVKQKIREAEDLISFYVNQPDVIQAMNESNDYDKPTYYNN